MAKPGIKFSNEAMERLRLSLLVDNNAILRTLLSIRIADLAEEEQISDDEVHKKVNNLYEKIRKRVLDEFSVNSADIYLPPSAGVDLSE